MSTETLVLNIILKSPPLSKVHACPSDCNNRLRLLYSELLQPSSPSESNRTILFSWI